MTNVNERAADMEFHVRSLVRYITSGDHYETKNPYARPPVKAALQALSRHYGGDWMDANKSFEAIHARGVEKC